MAYILSETNVKQSEKELDILPLLGGFLEDNYPFWSLFTAEVIGSTSSGYNEYSNAKMCNAVIKLFGATSSVALTYTCCGSGTTSSMSGYDMDGFSSVYTFYSSGTIRVSYSGNYRGGYDMGVLSNVSVS